MPSSPKKTITIDNHKQLSLAELKQLALGKVKLALKSSAKTAVVNAAKFIENALKHKKTIYGVNTGFGKLANVAISTDKLRQLQHNIILSHAAGVGHALDDDIVRLILATKIKSLAYGYSGVRLETLTRLLDYYNHQIIPHIPEKGSVGASGDLAPLAHLALCLIGKGKMSYRENKIKYPPLELAPKEGLALLNGTQVSTSIALKAFFLCEIIFDAAVIAGSLSAIAAGCDPHVFHKKIHQLKNQRGQIYVGNIYDELLTGSNYAVAKNRVQSPYSLRCQPQVMGACWDQLQFASDILEREANAVSDNPLIFAEDNCILHGGNFHAEPVAFAADNLALVFAEMGSLSERRIALLIDANFSGLPGFLVADAGLNSGFMLTHVTAASLASENKSLAHPASVDSIPTSANQEDHVSMATFAARRLLTMADNTLTIIAIELLAACQGIDFAKPKKLHPKLEKMMEAVRSRVPFYSQDRFVAPDIEAVRKLILDRPYGQYP